MEDKIVWINKMKKHLDSIYPLSQELYHEMAKFLNLKHYPKGAIIKDENKVDTDLRYICQGILGLFKSDGMGNINMIRPYFKGDIVCDFESFSSGLTNDYIIKSYSDSVLITLDKRYEEELFTSNPRIAMLSIRLHYQIHVQAFFWDELKIMKPREAYDTLIGKYPAINDELLFKDVASALNISLRSFNRLKGGK